MASTIYSQIYTTSVDSTLILSRKFESDTP